MVLQSPPKQSETGSRPQHGVVADEIGREPPLPGFSHMGGLPTIRGPNIPESPLKGSFKGHIDIYRYRYRCRYIGKDIDVDIDIDLDALWGLRK